MDESFVGEAEDGTGNDSNDARRIRFTKTQPAFRLPNALPEVPQALLRRRRDDALGTRPLEVRVPGLQDPLPRENGERRLRASRDLRRGSSSIVCSGEPVLFNSDPRWGSRALRSAL